jgi:A/G-specific adenine glycosylase
MLQQTRVETVLPYYEKWVERFPTLDALAEADEDEVLRLWQGLGYYSRARRLQEGARMVRERYGGFLPEHSEDLRELPGVGEYTAGAVASIAFGEVVPAVDGNVRRVLSRLFDLADPSSADLRTLAENLVDPERPGDSNQALMELGALVCLPRSPRCEDCPVHSHCLAVQRGTVEDRPPPRERGPVPEKDVAVLVLVATNPVSGLQVLLRKRSGSGLLAGMWEFPGADIFPGSPADRGVPISRALADLLASLIPGAPPEILEMGAPLAVFTHQFSHLRIRYQPVLVRLPSPDARFDAPEPVHRGGPNRWVPICELEEIPLPAAQQKIGEAARKHLGL